MEVSSKEAAMEGLIISIIINGDASGSSTCVASSSSSTIFDGVVVVVFMVNGDEEIEPGGDDGKSGVDDGSSELNVNIEARRLAGDFVTVLLRPPPVELFIYAAVVTLIRLI